MGMVRIVVGVMRVGTGRTGGEGRVLGRFRSLGGDRGGEELGVLEFDVLGV
jgi:hypothetical protein